MREPTWMLPVRWALVLSSRRQEIPTLPVPLAPTVIWIQVVSGKALQAQTSPVVTVMRPVLAAGPAVALYAESEILPGDPSCVTATAGGAVRFVCNSVMVPLRAATQVFAATE